MKKMYGEYVIDTRTEEMPPKGWHFLKENGCYVGWGNSSEGVIWAIVRPDNK